MVDPLDRHLDPGCGHLVLRFGALTFGGHEPVHRPDGRGKGGALGLAGLQGHGDVEVEGLEPAPLQVDLVFLGATEGQHRKTKHGGQIHRALQGRGQGGDPVAQPGGQGFHGEGRHVRRGADGERIVPRGVLVVRRVRRVLVERLGVGERILREGAFEQAIVVVFQREVLHRGTPSPALLRKIRQRPPREVAICRA